MSKQLSEALNRLAEATEVQIGLSREILARDRRREMEARISRPEFQAEMVAKARPARPFSALAFIRACPAAFAGFTKFVPAEFYTRVDAETLLIACPCGEDHGVGDRGFPYGASCGRYFLYDGERMRVAYEDETRPES